MNKMICVVGAGYWGKNHIKSLKKLGSLSGVVDFNRNILRQIRFNCTETRILQIIEKAIKCNYYGLIIPTAIRLRSSIAKI